MWDIGILLVPSCDMLSQQGTRFEWQEAGCYIEQGGGHFQESVYSVSRF